MDNACFNTIEVSSSLDGVAVISLDSCDNERVDLVVHRRRGSPSLRSRNITRRNQEGFFT